MSFLHYFMAKDSLKTILSLVYPLYDLNIFNNQVWSLLIIGKCIVVISFSGLNYQLFNILLINYISSLFINRLASVIKMYGTQLKASAALIRLRLYDVLSQIPPESFDGMFCQ